MAFTLLINPGSSSKKYSLIHEERVISNAIFEKYGDDFNLCIEQDGLQQKCEGITSDEFGTALHQFLDHCLSTKILENLKDVTSVGIRVVAPGTFFQKHQVVDDLFIHKLRACEPSAPLHIPYTIKEIDVVKIELPHSKVISVSDSAFHSTMPSWSRDYSIEVNDTKEFDIHRFGYHGISVSSVLKKYQRLYGNIPAKVIVAHVGSGVSMTAIKDRLSMDTSMGFAPDSGLVMGSRAGDLDSGALLELMRAKNIRLFDTLSYIQKRGGLKGMTGEADFRLLLEKVGRSEETAIAALHHFVYHFQKQLGAYAMALQGIDAIILTATASERSSILRHYILENIEWFGIKINVEKNDLLLSGDGVISADDSLVKVVVIRTAELTEMLEVVNTFAV